MKLNEVKLEKITLESKTILENLMTLFLHDLSEFASDLKINEAGKFEYEGLHLYFKSEDLKPFFITYKGEIAGFVLFNSGKYAPKGIDYEVHELFLLKGFRRKGIASAAIRSLFDLYKGTYKIGQIADNKTAVSFWTNFYKNSGIVYEEIREKIDELEIDATAQIFNI